jgi:rubrerythrin
MSDLMLRLRSRRVWRDPARKLRTLESFARTEEDGGRDIAGASRRVTDAELAGHLQRHAVDERRHAELFRRRAAELRTARAGAGEVADPAADRAWDLSRGRASTEMDSHGFYTLGLLDELGEVPYVAMLHVAECRAAALFRVHHDLTRDDPPTAAVFEDILRDENYHVAWTAAMLKRWREEGRDEEVARALKAARASRFMGAWKRAGIRAAGNLGRLSMLLLYVTLLLPFGLLASRRRAGSKGWQPPRAPLARGSAAGGGEQGGREPAAIAQLRAQA